MGDKFLCKIKDHDELVNLTDAYWDKVEPMQDRMQFMINQLEKIDNEKKELTRKFWREAEEIMREHYASFLHAINKMTIGVDGYYVGTQEQEASCLLQI